MKASTLHPLKTQQNQRFSSVFMGYKIEAFIRFFEKLQRDMKKVININNNNNNNNNNKQT